MSHKQAACRLKFGNSQNRICGFNCLSAVQSDLHFGGPGLPRRRRSASASSTAMAWWRLPANKRTACR